MVVGGGGWWWWMVVVGGGGWWYIILINSVYKVERGKQNNTNYNRVTGAAWGIEEEWFQQSASTHSEAGEKETRDINVVGKYI